MYITKQYICEKDFNFDKRSSKTCLGWLPAYDAVAFSCCLPVFLRGLNIIRRILNKNQNSRLILYERFKRFIHSHEKARHCRVADWTALTIMADIFYFFDRRTTKLFYPMAALANLAVLSMSNMNQILWCATVVWARRTTWWNTIAERVLKPKTLELLELSI